MHSVLMNWLPSTRFQSAPAIAGGRCGLRAFNSATSRRFNPRPPLLAGDAGPGPQGGGGYGVSIRARHCWRAMLDAFRHRERIPLFQSAPAIAGGRCARSRPAWMARSCFNPRPPLLAGDAPAALGGLCDLAGFNPRPPLLAGDAHAVVDAAALHRVSIRARHCWRAMRACRWSARRRPRFQSAPAIAGGRCPSSFRQTTLWRRFNPRPPLLAGDALRPVRRARHVIVSIRARHCWRAMLRIMSRLQASLSFQSAPAIAGGRCPVPASLQRRRGRFNPRPPLLAGDASARRGDGVGRRVSIRARHCWRAMLRPGEVTVWGGAFQSAPAIAGGRCPRVHWAKLANAKFQSAPAIAGGRCAGTAGEPSGTSSFNPRPPLLAGDASLLGHSSNLERVSIRARHCWRAMLQASADHARGAKFQSAPAIAGGRCTAGTPATTRSWRFNPRPPLLAGDACASRAIRRASTVSIRARHCWRAMRCVQRSRPAYWAVSIRARHCWRAMLARSRIRASRRSSFNPRPPLLAGDAKEPRDALWYLLFQSAPAIAGGRCARQAIRIAFYSGFNPRPPLLAGDAPVEGDVGLDRRVSIRARHCWRAMRLRRFDDSAFALFQSAPAIAGGRCAR